MLNRRTFLNYSGKALSLPVAAKLNVITNEHTTAEECNKPIYGAPPTDVTTLLLRARRLISEPSNWCKDKYWGDQRFCMVGGLITETFRDGKNTPWPDIFFDSTTCGTNLENQLQAARGDDLLHTALWVISLIIDFRYDYNGRVELWNDRTSTTHSDIIDVLNMAIAFEQSDRFALDLIREKEKIRQDYTNVDALYEDSDFKASNIEPESVVIKAIERVVGFTDVLNAEKEAQILEDRI